ncbi:MAG: universal stress protein [Desulfovibrionaceae bacterium]
MERILVGTSPRQGASSALTRAISLAKRIKATVHVLFVTTPAEGEIAGTTAGTATEERRRLRLMVQQAQEEGVGIQCFMAEGDYAEEVVRFARDRKITLLVTAAVDGDGRISEQDSQAQKRILHGISCRVELVSPRREETPTQGKGSAT